MKRLFLTLPAAFVLMANSPAEVDTLLVEGKDAQAYQMAQAGAQAGDAELTGYLGWFHDNGRHVAEDDARAAELFRQAADMGDAYAQWRLAVMIDEGIADGTLEEAVALFRKAAAQKNADGMVGLGVMHATGRGTERDYEAAMRYYQAAARLGSAQGLHGIGLLYANGEGVEVDLAEAVAHWLVAAAAGHEAATDLLDQFSDQVPASETKALFGRADEIARTYRVNAQFELTEAEDGSASGG